MSPTQKRRPLETGGACEVSHDPQDPKYRTADHMAILPAGRCDV